MMSYQQIQQAVYAINHVCSGVTAKTGPDDASVMIRHDARFGPGYRTCHSIEEVYRLVPEIIGYNSQSDPLP